MDGELAWCSSPPNALCYQLAQRFCRYCAHDRPALAQTRADQRRFVDRTRETDAIIRAVAASQPVLLLGERGSGRTSLLNHVAWLLARQHDGRDMVMVTGELATNPSQLLGVLVARTQRLAEPTGSRARWIEDLRALSMPDGPFGRSPSRRS